MQRYLYLAFFCTMFVGCQMSEYAEEDVHPASYKKEADKHASDSLEKVGEEKATENLIFTTP